MIKKVYFLEMGIDMKETLTIEALEEAYELIKALAPKSAPDDLFMIRGLTDLRIMKSDMLQSNTIIVSKDLFDKIYESSIKKPSETGQETEGLRGLQQ